MGLLMQTPKTARCDALKIRLMLGGKEFWGCEKAGGRREKSLVVAEMDGWMYIGGVRRWWIISRAFVECRMRNVRGRSSTGVEVKSVELGSGINGSMGNG